MQLGNILATAQTPIICKPVKFKVLGQSPEGAQVQAQAEAAFAFVTEQDRIETYRLAAESVKPGSSQGTEAVYWFLMMALRDKDDPRVQFCPNSEIGRFRSSLLPEQVIWLKGQYDAFVREEYPELATPRDRDAMIEAAAGE